MKEQIERAVAVNIAKKFRHIKVESVGLPAEQPAPAGVLTLLDLFKRRMGTISLAWSKLG